MKKKQKQMRKGHLRFSDRLRNIKINSFRSVDPALAGGEELYTEGLQSHFQETFEGYLTTDHTEDFHRFASQVRPMISSLPLLLFHKADVWGALIDHLTRPGSLAVDPLLDLLTCLARDLVDEFYPFFRETLRVVVGLLDLRHADRIERCFSCIGYLFKFLRKSIVQEIDALFEEYYYLILSHPKEFIRQFSAESFAFLLRHVKREQLPITIGKMFDFLHSQVTRDEDDPMVEEEGNSSARSVDLLFLSDGLINLFFELMKGVEYGFHSRLPFYLGSVLEQFQSHQSEWSFSVVFGLIKKICQHTDAAHSTEFAGILLDHAHTLLDALVATPESSRSSSALKKRKRSSHASAPSTEHNKLVESIHYQVQMIVHYVEHRRGAFWLGQSSLETRFFALLDQLLPHSERDEFRLLSLTLSLCSSVVLPFQERESDKQLQQYLPRYLASLLRAENMQSSDNVTSICFFLRDLMALRTAFGQHVLPHIINMCNALAKEHFQVVTHLLLDVTDSEAWNRASAPALVRISHQNRLVMSPKGRSSAYLDTLLGLSLQPFAMEEETEELSYHLLWAALKVVQVVEVPMEQFGPLVKETLDRLVQLVHDPVHRGDEDFLVLAEAFQTWWMLQRTYQTKSLPDCWALAWTLIQLEPANLHILESALSLMDTMEHIPATQLKRSVVQKLKSDSQATALRDLVYFNLSSPNQQLRIATYRLLIHFEKDEPNALLAKFLRLEEVNKQSMEARTATHILSDLESYLQSVTGAIVPLLCHALVGTLQIKYTLLWPIAMKSLGFLVKRNFKVVFATLHLMLEKLHDLIVFQSLQFGDQKKAKHHILGRKKHRPAGEGMTAQDPKSIRTALEEDVDSYSDDPLNESFSNQVVKAERRLGYAARATDVRTLHSSLWKTFALFPHQVEQVGKKVVPFFLSFMQLQYAPAEWQSLTPAGLFDSFTLQLTHGNKETPTVTKFLPAKPLQEVLLDYLKLLALFKKPAALPHDDILRRVFEVLLAFGNTEVQRATLQCLFTWKFEFLTPYRESLERLADDKTTREEMTAFNITPESDLIKPQHRAELSRILIFIMHAKLIAVRRRSKLHRHTILSYLGGLEVPELYPLFQLILQPFDKFFDVLDAKDSAYQLYQAMDSSSPVHWQLTRPSLSRKSKVLVLLQDVLKQFGKRMEMYLPNILRVLVGLRLWEAGYKGSVSATGSIRSACIRRLATVIQLYPNYDYSAYLQPEFFSMLTPLLSLVKQSPKQTTPVLELFVAITGSPQLIVDLRQTECISLVIDCISTQASRGVLSQVLRFVDSLVNVHEMLNEETGDNFIQPYVDRILGRLDALQLKATSQSSLVEQVLQLLGRLAPYSTEKAQAERLVVTLLVYVGPSYSGLPLARKLLIFQIVEALHPLVQRPEIIVEAMSYQFLSLQNLEARRQLIELTCSLQKRLPGLDKITTILTKTNAYSQSMVGQYDFDERLAGFLLLKEYLETDEASAQPATYFYPLVYNVLYFLVDSDPSIRGHAEEALQQLMTFAGQREEDPAWSKIATHLVFPWIKKVIRQSTKESKYLQEALRILHHAVLSFPVNFRDLRTVARPEWSFFLQYAATNITERVKAVVQLKRVVAPQQRGKINFTASTYNFILVPLLVQPLLSTKSLGNLAEECIHALANLCSHLPWKRYYRQLTQFISMASRASSAQQKTIIRLCCVVLDEFHYLSSQQKKDSEEMEDVDDTMEDDEADLETEDSRETDEEADDDHAMEDMEDTDDEEELESTAEQENAEEAPEVDTSAADKKEESPEVSKVKSKEDEEDRYFQTATKDATDSDRQIFSALTRQVVPQLLRFMQTDKAEVSSNIHISLAVVKVIQLLPKSLQTREVPKLFKKIVQNLRSRDQETRDNTRQTLAQVLQTLGSEHFGAVLRELTSTLTRGYQLHILGFTIHSLLYNMQKSQSLSMNSLSHCVKPLSVALLDDIIGEAAEKKEVKQIQSSMKETKVTKSYESYNITARSIGFSNHIQDLIHPIYSVLLHTSSTKIIKKLNEALQKISIGLSKNQGISHEQMLIFLYTVINDNLQFFAEQEEAEIQSHHKPSDKITRLYNAPLEQDRLKIQPGMRSLKQARQSQTELRSNLHILAEFALSLLFSCLKHSRFDPKDDAQLAMLDPFVSMLAHALDSQHQKSMILALKCLTILVKFPLPSLETQLERINKKVFRLLRRTSARSELMGICFKMLVTLLRDCGPSPNRVHSIEIPEDQIKYLLSLANHDLDALERSALTFSFLRAVVGKQMILPELYDLMKRIGELVVSSSVPSVRQNCLQMFLNFLLYYPLGETRLQQHLDFLLKNLQYYSPEGRQSVLDLFHRIISRFPAEHMNKQAEYFYFSLVLSLVNDEDATCREMAGSVIKQLVQTVNESRFQSIYALTQKWLADASNLALQRAAAQLFGLLIDATEKNPLARMENILSLLTARLDDPDLEEEEDEDEDRSLSIEPFRWHVVYYAMVALEKLMRTCPQLLTEQEHTKEMKSLLWRVTGLMLHSHAWVRLLASRLLGLSFSSLQSPKDLSGALTLPCAKFLYQPGLGWLLARRMASQLRSPLLTQEDGQQIVRNLLFLSTALYFNQPLHQRAMEALPPSKQAIFSRSRATQKPTEEVSDEDDEENSQEKEHQVVHWIFRNLSFAARRLQKQIPTRLSILKYYAGMAMQIPAEEFVTFLLPVVVPLYHTSTLPTDDEQVSELAEQVGELIKSKVGLSAYMKAYQTIRKNAETSRLRKKKQQKVDMILDPEKAIKQKQHKNEKRRESRRRKILHHRPSRAGVPSD